MVCKTAENGTAFVQFVSSYGQVLKAGTYSTIADTDFPIAPSKKGYVFEGWSMTADGINTAITNGGTIEVKPVYVQETAATYTVAVQYPTELQEKNVSGYNGIVIYVYKINHIL